MKNYLILIPFLVGILACSQRKDEVNPLKNAYGSAKRAPDGVSVEDWGGLTMSIVSIDSSNKAARDTTWGTVWVGIPVKFRHMSHIYSNTYGIAWGEFANYQEMADNSVEPGGIDSDGMFYVNQLNTGPDPYGGDPAGAKVARDVTSAIEDIQWTDDAHYFGTIRPGIKQDMIDQLNSLREDYQTQQEDNASIAELNDWINNLNSDRAANSVAKTVNENTVMIMGRIVKKPDGTYGIVPPLWVPPIGG